MDLLLSGNAKLSVRSEPSVNVSEFNLASTACSAHNNSAKALAVGDLVDAVAGVKNVGRLKRQLASAHKKSLTLQTPLHKGARERIERGVAYAESKKKLGFWDEIVRQNRLIDCISFPLRRREGLAAEDGGEQIAQGTLDGACQRFNPRTELEIECDKLLKNSKNNLTLDEEYTEAEKEALKAMSLEEAQRRRDELCKMRALISYKTAQNKRKRAIKSKKFHRMAKRDTRKGMEKEVAELMRNNNTQAAKEKLKLLEMDRIAERSTLKHRGTGKWAQQIRHLAKKDPNLREALQNQLRLGKELAEKVFAAEKSDQGSTDDEMDHSKTLQPGGSKSLATIDLTPKIAQVAVKKSNISTDDGFEDQDALISEAFADDDVIDEELAHVMSDEGENGRVEIDQSGSMPGWNSWTGPGMVDKKRRKLKKKLAYVEKVAKSGMKLKKRKNVTINSNANESIRKLQVKQAPFPYSKSELFEETLAQPLGKEWNTSTSYSMLIRPSVRTKMGQAIEPISVDHLRGDKQKISRRIKAMKDSEKEEENILF